MFRNKSLLVSHILVIGLLAACAKGSERPATVEAKSTKSSGTKESTSKTKTGSTDQTGKTGDDDSDSTDKDDDKTETDDKEDKVKEEEGGDTEEKPPVEEEEEEEKPAELSAAAKAGKEYWNNNCNSCHLEPLAPKRGDKTPTVAQFLNDLPNFNNSHKKSYKLTDMKTAEDVAAYFKTFK